METGGGGPRPWEPDSAGALRPSDGGAGGGRRLAGARGRRGLSHLRPRRPEKPRRASCTART